MTKKKAATRRKVSKKSKAAPRKKAMKFGQASLEEGIVFLNKISRQLEQVIEIFSKPIQMSIPGPAVVRSLANSDQQDLGLPLPPGEIQPVGGNGKTKPAKKTKTQTAEVIPAEKAMKALQQVAAKKGLPAVKKVLEKFKAGKMGEVPVDQYGAFIKECDAISIVTA